ncbi:hypothetical protein ACP3TJ_11860, partial [Desulforudis sp. 1088]
LGYIEEGMQVKLTLNSDDKVTRIEITAPAGIQGTVTYIRTSGTKRIMIEKSNGQEETYYLADSVTVKEGSATRSLGYIEEDMLVELTLNSDDKVTRIEISGRAYVSGDVTYIRTSGTKRIMIEKSNGDEETYYLAETVTVKEGSATRSLGHIEVGMTVKLTLNTDEQVSRIDIL